MLFSWPFVAHFHLTPPIPLFCASLLWFPFCDLLLCILDLCFDFVNCGVLLLCIIVMVLFSPSVALFLQMCCGVFLLVFSFRSIVTHCFCFHLLLTISTHRTTIVLLCFPTTLLENFHVILFCCASPRFGLLWCLFSRVFQIFWWMACSQNDGYHVGSTFPSFVCCGKLGETWGCNLVDIRLWYQGCHSSFDGVIQLVEPYC